MFRLTREVRFAVNAPADGPAPPAVDITNSYAGYPSLAGAGQFFTLQVTLAGELDAQSQYLRNIKDIDAVVRERAVPAVAGALRAGSFGGGGRVAAGLLPALADAWRPAAVEAVRLSLSPFLAWSCLATEHPMVRLSQKFEFSASHRLHNPALSGDENRATFGKCSNPHGHGHNYEVQVTLRGAPRADGTLIDVPRFERIVAATVIDRFDHKHLNLEVAEFRGLIPTVENIAMVTYRLLKPKFADEGADLSSVTVWETPKTWCEYSE